MADHQQAGAAKALARAPTSERHNGHGELRRARPSLPTLFGRVTAVFGKSCQLVTLDQRLEVLGSHLVNGSAPPGEGPQPESLFSEASRELSEQFAREEADGYYGVILQEQPELGASVSNLKHDHTAILRVLELLGAVSSEEPLPQELGACTRGLVSTLRAHEHGEQLLLQALFSGPSERAASRSGTYNRARLADGESPLLVLLVDDERGVRSVVRRMLEDAGCGVVEAPDAMVALRLLLERRSAVSAIVSDVGLPEISGPDFVRAARVICPHIATMHMSGDTRDDLIATGRLGPDAVLLEKPFRRSDLVACLTAVLVRRN